MYHKIPFLMYLWQDPELKQMLLLLAGAVLFELMTAGVMVTANLNMAGEIRDLLEAEAPWKTYAFSRQGELEIYDDFAVFLRDGTRVSTQLSEIWDVSWDGEREDRVLHVKHMTEGGPVTEDVRCGPMDIFEAMKVRDMLLHYLGG